MKWAAVAVALASAFAYSVASVTQHREAGAVSTAEVGAPSLLLKLAVCLGFVVALRLTRVIQPEDLGAVREIVAARLRPAPGA